MLSVTRRAKLLQRVLELRKHHEIGEVVALLSRVPEVDLLADPELGLHLASALYDLDHVSESRRWSGLLEEPCRRRRQDRVYRRRLNLEGILLIEEGRFDEAERVLLEALSIASATGDKRIIANATTNLGAVAWVQCRWDESLAFLHRALAGHELDGDRFHVAGDHQNLGMCLRELGQLREANAHFERAAELYAEFGPDGRWQLAASFWERALVFTGLGDHALAETLARRALAIAAEDGAPRIRAEALRVLGIALANAGRPGEALPHFDEALVLARELSLPLLEAEVCEQLGAWGEPDDRRRWSAEAQRLYTRMGATARSERAGARLQGR